LLKKSYLKPFLSQIVIMLYEDPNEPVDSENRFHIELHFSPGEKIEKGTSDPGIMLNVPAPMSRMELKSHLLQTEAETIIDEAIEDAIDETESKIDKEKQDTVGELPENELSSSPITKVSSSRLQQFLQTSKLHKSAPETEKSKAAATKFTLGGLPELDQLSLHKSENSINESQQSLHPLSQSGQFLASSSHSELLMGGLGSGQNPLFSHNLISNDEKPCLRGRTQSSSYIQSMVEGNKFTSAPDVLSGPPQKTSVSDVDCSEQQMLNDLDYSMVTSISPLETLHNSLTLQQVDKWMEQMIAKDTLGQVTPQQPQSPAKEFNFKGGS
jgi:hypothetical protein